MKLLKKLLWIMVGMSLWIYLVPGVAGGTLNLPLKSVPFALFAPKHSVTLSAPAKTRLARDKFKKTDRILATIIPGSLRWNILRLAHRFGWPTVVWLPKQNYRWVGKTKIRAMNIQGLMRVLLKHYPLQAIFYEGNHVLVIATRTLK